MEVCSQSIHLIISVSSANNPDCRHYDCRPDPSPPTPCPKPRAARCAKHRQIPWCAYHTHIVSFIEHIHQKTYSPEHKFTIIKFSKFRIYV